MNVRLHASDRQLTPDGPGGQDRLQQTRSLAPPVDGLLMLQQTAGNRAVTSLMQGRPGGLAAQRAPAIVQQQPAQSAQNLSPWWPQGPTTARKQRAIPLGQYISWIKEVEAAYRSREDVIHRLRRLYYSNFAARGPKAMNPSGGAGPRFDKLISGNDDVVPITSPPVSQVALDGLFETDNIITPAGESLDPTHFLPALDLALHGPSTTGAAFEAISDAPLIGILTWTGDLSSWFVDWIDQKRHHPAVDDITLLLSRVNSKVSMDDLLSDLDAQAIVATEITTTVTVAPPGPHGIPPTVNTYTALNRPLSNILQDLYGTPTKATAPIKPNRFVRFIKAARPPIPHEAADSKKPNEVRLGRNAETVIFKAIYAAAEALLEGSNTITRVGTPDALEDNEHVVKEIARRFCAFLEKGLASGSAPWP